MPNRHSQNVSLQILCGKLIGVLCSIVNEILKQKGNANVLIFLKTSKGCMGQISIVMGVDLTCKKTVAGAGVSYNNCHSGKTVI